MSINAQAREQIHGLTESKVDEGLINRQDVPGGVVSRLVWGFEGVLRDNVVTRINALMASIRQCRRRMAVILRLTNHSCSLTPRYIQR